MQTELIYLKNTETKNHLKMYLYICVYIYNAYIIF